MEDNIENSENVIDSLAENTKKRILPNRPGRGQMMKLLQEKEPDEEDEFYNLIFAEKSSDEEFNPSGTEMSEDSKNSVEDEDYEENIQNNFEEGLASYEEKENSILSSINQEEENLKNSKKINLKPKIKLGKNEILPRQLKGKRNQKGNVEVMDIDLLDIDKIDEIEEMKEKGIYQGEFSSDEFSNGEEDDEESYNKKKKKKKWSKSTKGKKGKKVSSYRALKNNFVLTEKSEEKKQYKKAFIDDEEEDTFLKKRHRSFTHKLKNKSKISKSFKRKLRLQFQANPNVIFTKRDPDTLIIKKKIFIDDNEEVSMEQDNDDDIMEYNDEFYRDQEKRNIQTEEENKKIIKKLKKPEKGQDGTQAPVRYNFMQEKLSQKDLLIEAIFTEYYNIQSLQEMQRLEDLNKKEMPTQGRRQFTEYVRILKRIPKAAMTKDKLKLQENNLQNLQQAQDDKLREISNKENDMTQLIEDNTQNNEQINKNHAEGKLY